MGIHVPSLPVGFSGCRRSTPSLNKSPRHASGRARAIGIAGADHSQFTGLSRRPSIPLQHHQRRPRLHSHRHHPPAGGPNRGRRQLHTASRFVGHHLTLATAAAPDPTTVPTRVTVDGGALVCWPAEFPGGELYWSTNLGLTNWTLLPEVTNHFREPPPPVREEFFRLRGP